MTSSVTLDDAVSGIMLVEVGDALPSHEKLRNLVSDPHAGAVVTFEGVTREVEALEYEAYLPMAGEQILSILKKVVAQTDICRVAVAHRVGHVPLGAASIVTVVSAAHRDSAYGASRQIIDEIKLSVPIWKTELDGRERTRVEGTVPRV